MTSEEYERDIERLRRAADQFRDVVEGSFKTVIDRLERDLEVVTRDRDALKKDNEYAGQQIEEANKRIRELRSGGRKLDQPEGRYQTMDGKPLGEAPFRSSRPIEGDRYP